MKSAAMDAVRFTKAVAPSSLKDVPSLIERVWPAQKISVESQKERKAVQGQTLVGLASYWKGRKPLSLVRACILGALLPATDDVEADLRVFDLLMGMTDDQVLDRLNGPLSVSDVVKYGTEAEQDELLEREHRDGKRAYLANLAKMVSKDRRRELMHSILLRMPYQERVARILRAEEVDRSALYEPYLAEVNAHLGLNARSVSDVVEQLGELRFGHKPKVGDTFSGGGSIPFEAARLGCDVLASDLNPIACMLTWGAIEFLGSTASQIAEFEAARRQVIDNVRDRIAAAGYETSENGDQARIFL